MPRRKTKIQILENEALEGYCIQFKRSRNWHVYQRICEHSNNLIDSIILKSRYHRSAPFLDIKNHLFLQIERWIDRWIPAHGKVYTYFSTSLTGDTKVMLADGGYMRLDEIVDNRLEVMVKAFDPTTGQFVNRRVIDWHRNPVADRNVWRRISVKAPGGNHIRLFATHDHEFYTGGVYCAHQPGCEKSWRPIGDYGDEDQVYVMGEQLTDYGKQAILGMWLGDGCVGKSYLFSTNHADSQKGYIRYTASKIGASLTQGCSSQFHDDPTWSWGKSLKSCWPNVEGEITWPKKITKDIANRIDPVSLAYWFMDDGSRVKNRITLHTEGFTRLECTILQNHLRERFGLDSSYNPRKNSAYGYLSILGGREAAFRFSALVSPHVHPSMDYKIYPEHRGQFQDHDWIISAPVACEVDVKGIVGKNLNKQKTRCVRGPDGLQLREWYTPNFNWKYDITVDGDNTRNFLIEGDGPNPTPVIVANCVKHGAISYIAREKLLAQRVTYTDKPLDALSSTTPMIYEMELSPDAIDEIARRANALRIRWEEQDIKECLRYTILCALNTNVVSRRKEILRTIQLGWPDMHLHDVNAGKKDTPLLTIEAMSKLLLDWSIATTRQIMLDIFQVPLRDEDIIRASDRYSFIPDIAQIVGWENTKKLMAVFAGMSVKFPTTVAMKRYSRLKVICEAIQKSPTPDTLANLARTYRISQTRLEEQIASLHDSIANGALGTTALFDGVDGFPKHLLEKGGGDISTNGHGYLS